MRGIALGPHTIDRTSAPYVIAEAGVNHNGCVDRAHSLVEAAADAGAHAVKFQTFDPSLLVRSGTATADYQQRETGQADQRAMLDQLALPSGSWPELVSHAAELGLTFLSTPFDARSLDALMDLGVPALKASSADLTNHLLLRAMASTGLPLLLSTGGAFLNEVEDAVDVIGGTDRLVLFHCVMSYPAPIATANLRAIRTLLERFDCPVGWSDHTEGTTSAIAAQALGANVFEKHLTLDRSLPGPDHRASADPTGFAHYVRAIGDTWAALGSGEKQPDPCEIDTRRLVRRGLHAARLLPAGTMIGPADIVALRPASEIDATVDLVGRTLVNDVSENEAIRWNDLS